jgi:hypothetical protein
MKDWTKGGLPRPKPLCYQLQLPKPIYSTRSSKSKLFSLGDRAGRSCCPPASGGYPAAPPFLAPPASLPSGPRPARLAASRSRPRGCTGGPPGTACRGTQRNGIMRFLQIIDGQKEKRRRSKRAFLAARVGQRTRSMLEKASYISREGTTKLVARKAGGQM